MFLLIMDKFALDKEKIRFWFSEADIGWHRTAGLRAVLPVSYATSIGSTLCPVDWVDLLMILKYQRPFYTVENGQRIKGSRLSTGHWAFATWISRAC